MGTLDRKEQNATFKVFKFDGDDRADFALNQINKIVSALSPRQKNISKELHLLGPLKNPF